jgi:hypothetical protein
MTEQDRSRAWLFFLKVARPRTEPEEFGHVLCLDPGETTGWALFVYGELVGFGQWPTTDPAVLADCVAEVARTSPLSRIVYEEYRVRGNKFKEHVGSEVLTIQHVGAIKVVADELGLPLTKQTAGMAKGFATDTKLRRWGLYQRGLRHANDAIRHGVYWLLFAAARKEP